MGRLTLNILLSFAQFEREVIGERIRDKFAASRARGHVDGRQGAARLRRRDRKLVDQRGRGGEGADECSSGSPRSDPAPRRCASCGPRASPARPASLLEKGDLYKLLNNRTYLGEAVHKGRAYPGEHEAIIRRALWDRVHAILQESPRARANRNRSQTPALLHGLIFGTDGRAMSPTHTRRRGRLYRYYVSQSVLKAREDDPAIVRRVSAAEIERAVIDQLRALLRQPEIIVGTWRAAREEAPDLTEAEVREALAQLDPLWEELFPAEQARIVRLLVERVEVGPDGADIRLRVAGLTSLMRELRGPDSEAQKAAA